MASETLSACLGRGAAQSEGDASALHRPCSHEVSRAEKVEEHRFSVSQCNIDTHCIHLGGIQVQIHIDKLLACAVMHDLKTTCISMWYNIIIYNNI